MKNKVILNNVIDCCGCGACKNVCSQRAISLIPNDQGFLCPEIDESKCVHCGNCLFVCDFKKFTKSKELLIKDTYLVRHKEEQIVLNSQSGGCFVILSERTIANGGVVCACCIDDFGHVYHSFFDDLSQISKFTRSKYVQSDLKNTFLECLDILLTGRQLLFVGTPCQTHSLLSFLVYKHVDISNLILCDIICHGVPSPSVWSSYLEYITNNKKKKVEHIFFRDKRFGWHSHIETLEYCDGTTKSFHGWRDLYYSHNMLRESCFNCPYTTPNRKSDITIGDAWGVEKILPNLDDNKGLSLSILHSEKGKAFFKEAIKDHFCVKVYLSDFLQPQLLYPPKKGEQYDCFWQDFKTNNSDRFIKKWFFPSKHKLLLHHYRDILKRLFGR